MNPINANKDNDLKYVQGLPGYTTDNGTNKKSKNKVEYSSAYGEMVEEQSSGELEYFTE